MIDNIIMRELMGMVLWGGVDVDVHPCLWFESGWWYLDMCVLKVYLKLGIWINGNDTTNLLGYGDYGQ